MQLRRALHVIVADELRAGWQEQGFGGGEQNLSVMRLLI